MVTSKALFSHKLFIQHVSSPWLPIGREVTNGGKKLSAQAGRVLGTKKCRQERYQVREK